MENDIFEINTENDARYLGAFNYFFDKKVV